LSQGPHAVEAREAGLERGLTRGQIIMIGLGGAIGTGLFLGSSLAIEAAGPAVLVSYLLAALPALAVVLSLTELVVAHPTAGAFGAHAEIYLGPWAGFVVRYTYWYAQVVAIGGEAVAVGVYMGFWLPGVPGWIWTALFGAGLLGLNLTAVRNFGRFEYGLSLIKVTAIVAFILGGGALIAGWRGHPVGFHNLVGLPGGFAPKGLTGIAEGVIVGVYSFVGIEVIAVTSGEAQDARRVVPGAMIAMAVRLFLFYVLALGIVVTLAPWTDLGRAIVKESPFVKVFAGLGVPSAAGVMNLVVISAALSSMNTSLYLCARMLFSLSRGGYAPRALGNLNRRGVPAWAAVVSSVGVVGATLLSMYTPEAYKVMFGVALFGAMVVWLFVLVSHAVYRWRGAERHGAAFWSRLWLQALGAVALVAILGGMAFSPAWNIAWIVGLPWLALLTGAYWLMNRRSL
jgi:amino acid transporter, AAT family